MRKNKKLKIQVSLPRLENDPNWAQEIEQAARFFLKELMSVRLQNTLNIKIHVRKTTLGANTMGTHYSVANGCESQKEHKIVLDYNASMETLAHELVHVQQAVSKRLQYRVWKSDHQLHVRWEGQELGNKERIPYRQRPWEIEAFDLAAKLFKKYKTNLIDQCFENELKRLKSLQDQRQSA